MRYGEEFAADAADDACVANSDHRAAVGVGEGGRIDLDGTGLVWCAAICARGRLGVIAAAAAGRLEVGEEEGVWGELGEGLRCE